MNRSDRKENKNSSKKQIVAVLISLAVICLAFFIGFNFKKIATLLPLPFEIPESWENDGTEQNDIVQSSITNNEAQSSTDKNTNEQNEEFFEKYFEWFFTADFPAFEQSSKADNDCAIELGIMLCIKSESNVQYKKNEEEETIVPAADVLSAVRKMLPSITITDKTVDEFVYDLKTQSYEIPAKAIEPEYMWFITSNKKIDNGRVLTVAFYPYNIATNNKIPTDSPEKTMILTLEQDQTTQNYKIVSYLEK